MYYSPAAKTNVFMK